MEELIDIKDFVTIEDNSLYLFIGLILLVFFCIFMLYILYKRFNKSKKTKLQIAKEELLKLNLNDTKKSAYTLSKYTPFLVQSDEQNELLNSLLQMLTKYKYKKIVPPFSNEDKKMIKMFLKAFDV